MTRILITDDEKDIVNALEIYLKPEGYEIQKAYTGKEAVDAVRQGNIDLVLLDVMMPVMAGLAACARPLIRLLLGEQWLPSVPYMQIFCVIYAFYPLHTANLNAIKAVGRSDIFLKLFGNLLLPCDCTLHYSANFIISLLFLGGL